MKRMILMAVAAILLLNGYPQRILNPQAYWSGRIKHLQEKIQEEQEELTLVQEQLAELQSGGQIKSVKLQPGVELTPEEKQEIIASKLTEQQQCLRRLRSTLEALKKANEQSRESV